VNPNDPFASREEARDAVMARLAQLQEWQAILLGDDEEAKRELVATLDAKDLVPALSTLDPDVLPGAC